MIHEIQIDAKKYEKHESGIATVVCNMYTGNRCITIVMKMDDYNDLMRDGFFIRDGKTKDSAGVLNTTNVFK